MDGLLVIDKPAGLTSHDVVARVRRMMRQPSVGHTGTLDPAATGVLPLVLGRATRLARFLTASDKAYDAVVRLGFATDTGDASGVRIGDSGVGDRSVGDGCVGDRSPYANEETCPREEAHPRETCPRPSRDAIEHALQAFRGTYLQQPPAFSAKKIGGKRSHALARDRKGSDPLQIAAVLPSPVTVSVHRLEIVEIEADRVTLRVECSAGFYVRSLAHDLGVRLGTGAHLAALRRVRSGDYGLADAMRLETAECDAERAARHVIPLARMLPGLPSVTLTIEGVQRATHGRDLGAGDLKNASGTNGGESLLPTPEFPIPTPHFPDLVRLLAPDGDLIGIATPTASGLLHPSVVLV